MEVYNSRIQGISHRMEEVHHGYRKFLTIGLLCTYHEMNGHIRGNKRRK